MKQEKSLKFDVALLQEDTQWVAVVLGPFIAAQGPTKEDALESLQRIYHAMATVSNGPMWRVLAEKAKTPPEYRENALEIVNVSFPAYNKIY